MKRLIVGLLLVFVLVGTVACASSEKSGFYPEPAPAPAPASPIFEGRDTSAPPPVVIEQMPPPVINIPPAPTPTPTSGSAGYDQSWAGERMIIRTGYMTLVVVDVASAMEQITNLAASYDGFVVSSNSWQEQDRMMGSISIRVVSERFNDTLGALRALAVEVRSESTSGQDVTEEYVDLTAKLRNLEAAETQLLKLMEQAGEVSDILEVQRELVKTRGEIEQTKGRMQYLEQSSSMSYIEVQLQQSKLTVEFTADPRSVKTGRVVWFFPNVSGGFEPYSYEWDFGDGSTSTDVQPSHSYKSDGTYTVKLKVTDDRGNMVPCERDGYITVLPGWSAGNIASSAWNGLVGFGHVLLDILIWLGIFSPVWIVIGVILYFAWWRKRKKA